MSSSDVGGFLMTWGTYSLAPANGLPSGPSTRPLNSMTFTSGPFGVVAGLAGGPAGGAPSAFAAGAGPGGVAGIDRLTPAEIRPTVTTTAARSLNLPSAMEEAAPFKRVRTPVE